MTTNEARPIEAGPSSVTGREEPLLSGGGRDFLDGKIDADEYVKIARQKAAIIANFEVNSDLRRERNPLRKNTEGVLFSAALAYLILGSITFITGSQRLVGTTAFVTGLAFAVTAFAFTGHFRNRR
jgi:hypothetical protein